MLQAEISKRLPALDLEVSLSADPGRPLVLVGESGTGKSTVLNLLAGLVTPDRGRIQVDGDSYFDSVRSLNVPAHRRSIGYVFQDFNLLPHLTAAENVAFGLRARGLARREARRRAREALESVGLSDADGTKPDRLSGGQQQRVALARALVIRPQILLLDEPLSAVDLSNRRKLRGEIRELLAQLTCYSIVVTHSPFEALLFGDQIAVMEEGRIAQVGGRDQLLCHPRSRYVAEFVGLNFFRGRVSQRYPDGLVDVETDDGTIRVTPGVDSDELLVAVDPRDITLHPQSPASSAQNVFRGMIKEVVPEPPLGERVRVAIETHPPLVAEVTAHAVANLNLREGMEIFASFKATRARSYD